MRKRVFISGPISRGDLCDNINQATAAFVALAKAGFAPLCPHWSVYSKPAEWTTFRTRVVCVATAGGNDEMARADWMAVDLPWVAVADAVLRLPGESAGADAEAAHATANSVPVFESIEALVAHFAGGAA